MASKKEKDIIHEPDFFVRAFSSVSTFVRENTRRCIYGLIVFVIVTAGIVSYFLYAHHQDQKTQYELSLGISAFGAYTSTLSKDDIDKAEHIFQNIADRQRGNARDIARLYLARINLAHGRKDEALALYRQVAGNSKNRILADLAESVIKNIDKKE